MMKKRRKQFCRPANLPEDSDFETPPEGQTAWWLHPPRDVEGMLHILATRAFKLKEDSPEGEALRKLLEIVEEKYNETQDEIRRQYPIAYFKPSYEQSLLLNAWIWGIDFVVCFAANRIGKTVALGVINPCLWILPNNPEWEIFAARTKPNKEDGGQTFIENEHSDSRFYYDLFDRPVQVLQRPNIEALDLIRFTLRMHPELLGNVAKSHLEPENAEKFAALQKLCPQAFNPAWPAPAVTDNGTIWLGAPDNDFHTNVILPEWKRWLPQSNIAKWSDSDLAFSIVTADTTNPKPTTHRVICKSYESEDTKWSGSAVRAIVLTEGLPQEILNEIKQRFKVNAFGSWDYTPYEARNVGNKTALAYRVFKGDEQLPLRAHIFTRFSARTAPAHIIPPSKLADLVRMWEGKKEGEARLDGIFYSSSPLVLSKLDRAFHTVPWSVDELFERYPEGQVYRGLDPGYDHPTVCCWGLLVPGNIWFIYRFYSERGKTIGERCKDIVRLSGNELKKDRFGPGKDEYLLREVHPHDISEAAMLTAADFHLFKTDENTGVNYSLNYQKGGLILTESTHMAPEDRALDFDDKLDKSEYHTHPVSRTTPGCRVFFLINGLGVDAALGRMESLFWDRLASGPNKGEAKDKVPVHGDDELDAACYLVCGPYIWTNLPAMRFDSWVDEEDLENLETTTRKAA